MNSPSYLPRQLRGEDKIYDEVSLLVASPYIVVLAEPGGGKTELLKNLASQLGTRAVTANAFTSLDDIPKNSPLVIDAFDELAKVDNTGIDKLFRHARRTDPKQVIISSRSSEWDEASTQRFKQFFDSLPLVVRLCEFDETEQRKIFQDHAPDEDFYQFQEEVARFDLAVLLANPQFLKLFANAYIESGRHFTDKRSIFTKAIEHLAKEVNTTLARPIAPLSTERKIDLASEIFAKLLLSGANGVCTSEANETLHFPWLVNLTDGTEVNFSILATRFFKPGDNPDLHCPVHKIVAEYCAANYLRKRIADPQNPLSLSKCLAIIAPKQTVRDDLRGLLGWLAALGDKSIQEDLIKIDPYAILANGDPSQLADSSKRLLIRQLKEVEAHDPYFRRGDLWRRFSVAGFFTHAVVDEIKFILMQAGKGNLRGLMLELLAGAPIIGQLTNELRQLALTLDEDKHTRILANSLLLETTNHDHDADLAFFIKEGSKTSLELAADTIRKFSAKTFVQDRLIDFFQACAQLYPKYQVHEREIGSRYFIKKLIAELKLATVEGLLDDLTTGLACHCGKQSFECDCRNGISKIVGSMLDRYFVLAAPPFDPIRVWKWVRNLNFHEQYAANQSEAVKVLRNNDDLRQGIIVHVLGRMTDLDQIANTLAFKFGFQSHAGLNLQANDDKFIVDWAFNNDNPILWLKFVAGHQRHRAKSERGPDSLRRHMREQASAKPAFMYVWAKANRGAAEFFHQNSRIFLRSSRRSNRSRKRQNDVHSENIKYIKENKALVESGRHFRSLHHFSQLVLMSPEKIIEEVGDEEIVRKALRNCLDFIAPDVPDLRRCAELHCASQGLEVETVLYAACLEIFRISGNLDGIDRHLLQSLRARMDFGYEAVSKEDRNSLKTEINRLIFPNTLSIEQFLRNYLEPQLAQVGCIHPHISLLRNDKTFTEVRTTLSIEWLRRFPDLDMQTLDSLFAIAIEHDQRDDLDRVITERCAQLMTDYPQPTENDKLEEKRQFWLLRAWYFLHDAPAPYWEWLSADKNTIFMHEQISGRHNSYDYQHWPKLSLTKLEAILIAFIGVWPKVDLPGSYGTESPLEEKAYRFLVEAIWQFESAEPEEAIPVLDRLLADSRFSDMHLSMKSVRAAQCRKKYLRNFEPPTPQQIVQLLDRNEVVTVEGLRQLMLEELQIYQKEIDGGEFNPARRFYTEDKHLNENACTEIIAERLKLRLQPQGIAITPEHQLKDEKRSDFTATKIINGKRCLLVTEVKGQWHKNLYTAAVAQLYERYAIHQDAEQQGIYLAIWFGASEEVAGRKNQSIANAEALKLSIEETLPAELKGQIDVFVLDVSKR